MYDTRAISKQSYRKTLIIGVYVSPWLMSKLDIVIGKRIADRSVSRYMDN